jgi:hypothetical protein
MAKIAYICNGLVPECSGKPGCFKFGKPGFDICHHTLKVEYAKYGPCDNPEKYPGRFNHLEPTESDYIEYWEGTYDWPE